MKLKFRYGQQVRITTGFYEGQVGRVIAFRRDLWITEYTVDLKKIGKEVWFTEKHLEPCGKPDKK